MRQDCQPEGSPPRALRTLHGPVTTQVLICTDTIGSMLAYVEPGSTGPLSQGAFLALWVGSFLVGALSLVLVGASKPDQRPAFLGFAGLFAVVAVSGFAMPAGRPLDARGVESGAQQAASALSLGGGYLLGRPGQNSVQSALDDAAGPGRLRASAHGNDWYTVTNSDGDHPVCLKVIPGSRTEDYSYGQPSVSVARGRC